MTDAVINIDTLTPIASDEAPQIKRIIHRKDGKVVTGYMAYDPTMVGSYKKQLREKRDFIKANIKKDDAETKANIEIVRTDIEVLEAKIEEMESHQYNWGSWTRPKFTSPRTGSRLATIKRNSPEERDPGHGKRDCGGKLKSLAQAVELAAHHLSDFTSRGAEAHPHPKANGSNEVQTFKFKSGLDSQEQKELDTRIQWVLGHLVTLTEECLQLVDAQIEKEECPVQDCRTKESKGSRPKSLDFKVGDHVKLTTGAADMMMHMIYGMSDHPYGKDVKSINMDPNTTYLVTGFNMEQEEGKVMQIAHMVKVGDELQTHTWNVMRQTFKKVSKK